MKDKLHFYINGKWVESKSNEKIEIINPANEDLIGHITAGTKDDINHQEELTFSKGCGVHNCDCKCKKSD